MPLCCLNLKYADSFSLTLLVMLQLKPTYVLNLTKSLQNSLNSQIKLKDFYEYFTTQKNISDGVFFQVISEKSQFSQKLRGHTRQCPSKHVFFCILTRVLHNL